MKEIPAEIRVLYDALLVQKKDPGKVALLLYEIVTLPPYFINKMAK